MSENAVSQMQHTSPFFERLARDNAAAFEAAVDVSVVMTKASLTYAAQMSEQWGKLATDLTRRITRAE